MRLRATAAPLQSWQDPQADVLLQYSERVCEVHFSCWTEDAHPAEYSGVLRFDGALAVRSERSEFVPFDVGAHGFRSYLLEVADSSWADSVNARDGAIYGAQSVGEDRPLRHYVVVGHDVYHEVWASGYREERVWPASARNAAEQSAAADGGRPASMQSSAAVNARRG